MIFFLNSGSLCFLLKTQLIFLHSQEWQPVLSLNQKRAYASGAVLPNSEFWISGGASTKDILKTIEILFVKNGEWKLRNGPKMPRALIGHCFASLNAHEGSHIF